MVCTIYTYNKVHTDKHFYDEFPLRNKRRYIILITYPFQLKVRTGVFKGDGNEFDIEINVLFCTE